MIAALVYTSAKQGLFPGSTGFSVVGCTHNADSGMRKMLEELSGYTPLYPHYSPEAWNNPINYSHRIVMISGQKIHVLSRICFNGVDYTHRSNKLASHIALSEDECQRLPSGPAAVFLHKELFKEANWEITTGYLDDISAISDPGMKAKPCETWGTLVGDAGWAGAVIEKYLSNPKKNIYFTFAPEVSQYNLELIHEAILLLPVEKRWDVTFNTFYTENVVSSQCQWRFCPKDSEMIVGLEQKSTNNIIYDFTHLQGEATGGEMVTRARTGEPKLQLKRPTFESTVVSTQVPNVPYISQTVSRKPMQVSASPQKTGSSGILVGALFFIVIVGALIFAIKDADNHRLAEKEAQIERLQKFGSEVLNAQTQTLQEELSHRKQVELPNIDPKDDFYQEVTQFVRSAVQMPEKDKPMEDKAIDLNNRMETLLIELKRFEELSMTILQNLGDEKKLYERVATQNQKIADFKEMVPSCNVTPIEMPEKPQTEGEVLETLKSAMSLIKKWEEVQNDLKKAFPLLNFPPPHIEEHDGSQDQLVSKLLPVSAASEEQDKMGNSFIEGKPYIGNFEGLLPEVEKIIVFIGKDEIKPDEQGSFAINSEDPEFKITIEVQKERLLIQPNKNAMENVRQLKLSLKLKYSDKSVYLDFYKEE